MIEKPTPEAGIYELGYTDELTGLHNRRWLTEALKDAAETSAEKFGLIVVDLDGLKKINDQQGHSAGDAHIQKAAYILQQNVRSGHDKRTDNTHQVREADAPLLGRMSGKRTHESNATRTGGDEFIVIILGVSDQEALDKISLRLQQRLADSHIPASVGAAHHSDVHTPRGLLETADKRMYEDKERRKTGKYDETQATIARSIIRMAELAGLDLHDLPAFRDRSET